MRRHSADLVSLVFGLVFLVVAALWPLWRFDVLDADTVTWFPATALIAIGVLGLVLSIAKARGPSREPEPAAVELHDDSGDYGWESAEEAATAGDETPDESGRST